LFIKNKMKTSKNKKANKEEKFPLGIIIRIKKERILMLVVILY